jgi:hypothetical protein
MENWKIFFWILSRLMIVAVAFMNIILLALELQDEERTGFFQITLWYSLFFVVNSQLLSAAFRSKILMALSCWISLYLWFLLSQSLTLLIFHQSNYSRLPITSKIAAEYLVQALGINPSWQIGVELGLSCLLCCVIIVSMIISILLDEDGNASQRSDPPAPPARARAPSGMEFLPPRYAVEVNSLPPPYSVV